MVLQKINFMNDVTWVELGSNRVVLWDVKNQPDLSALLSISSSSSLKRSEIINHDARRREWLATRALCVAIMRHEPSESAVGYPIWNEDWLGSISHKSGHVAIWARRGGLVSCGVDLESCREFESGLAEKIMAPDELELSAKTIVNDSGSLIFSAKEAIYKALCPMVGRKFYFEAAILEDVAGGAGEFVLRFKIAQQLSAAVAEGSVVVVVAKRLQLSDRSYWLSLASYPRFFLD